MNAQSLLTNGGFETWAGGGGGGATPTGWTITQAAGTITQNTTLHNEGTSACRVVAANNNYTLSQSVSVTAGKTYTLRVSYYIETAITGGKEARINCNFRNTGGTGIVLAKEDSMGLIGPGGTTAYFPSVTGAWKTYTYDVVAPTGATTFFLSVVTARGATVSWDNFSFAENTTPTIYKYTYTVAGGFNYSPSITGLDYTTAGAGPSADQSFTVRASNLTAALTITAPTNFEVSATTGSSFVGQSSMQIPPSSGLVSPITLYVRLKSGLSSATYTGNLSLTSTGATTQTIPVSGYVGTPLPVITPSVTTLSGFSYNEGSGPSTQQSFTVSGSNLGTGLTITAPTNFEISALSGASFSGATSITLAGATLATTTIYVRLKAGVTGGTYTGNLVLSSGSTSQNIALSGSVSGINISATSITGFSYGLGAGPSPIKTFNVYGIGLTGYLILSAPTDFEISLTTGASFSATGQILLASTTTTATPIYVRMKAGIAVATYNENITITSTGVTTKTVALTGNVLMTTATTIPENSGMRAYSKSNSIVIEGVPANESVAIYNTTGMQIKTLRSTGETLEVSLPKGSVYLIRTSDKAAKVIL